MRPATTADRRPGLGGYTLGPSTFRRHLIAGLALPVLSLAMTAPPLAASAAPVSTVSFDIPAGPLDVALSAYAAQSHQQLLYTPELVAGRRAPAVRGALPASQVLRTLLADSPITATTIRPDVIVLKAADADKRGASFPAPPLGVERATALAMDGRAREAHDAFESTDISPSTLPPPLARVAGVERLQMLAEAGSRTHLQRLLRDWLPQLQQLKLRHKGLLRWAVDVDPLAI